MLQRVLQPAYTRSISIEIDWKSNWNCRNPMPTFHSILAVQRMLVLLSYRIGSPSLIGEDPSERRQNELDRRKKIEIVKLCTNLMECIYEEPWHFWVVTEEVENSNSKGILSHWVWGGLVDSMAVRQGKERAKLYKNTPSKSTKQRVPQASY